MVHKMKIGIIGFGNLGRSLTLGLIRSYSTGVGDIYVCDNDPEVLEIAKKAPYFTNASSDPVYVIKNVDVVFLVVKGYIFKEMAKSFKTHLFTGKTVVSFMAGETFEKIYSYIGKVDLVRAMPSLAIATNDGVIGHTKTTPAITDIFNRLGYAFETEPDSIEKFMAFSACGLGYAAYLIDALSSAGQAMGFPEEACTEIATITFQNAINRGDFRQTVKAVATQGGATEAGVAHLNEIGIYNIVEDAVRIAFEKMT